MLDVGLFIFFCFASLLHISSCGFSEVVSISQQDVLLRSSACNSSNQSISQVFLADTEEPCIPIEWLDYVEGVFLKSFVHLFSFLFSFSLQIPILLFNDEYVRQFFPSHRRL